MVYERPIRAKRQRIDKAAQRQPDTATDPTSQCRFVASEYEELERAAAAAGLSKAAFLRQCWKGHAGERARRSPTVDRQALAAVRANLARVGNNLNQLARAANMNQIPDLPELSATLADVRLAASESLKALGYRPHDSQG